MNRKSVYRLPLLAATCVPVLGAMIMVSASTSALAQESSSSTTTTTTTQPVPAPPPVTTVQTTTVTTVAPTSLYINKAHGDILHDGEAISARPDGRVYNSEGDYIGHLTSLSGSDIDAVPVRDEFKIRSPGGSMIASTRPSYAYDSDRKVMLSRNDEPTVAPSTSSTTTTRQTTVSP